MNRRQLLKLSAGGIGTAGLTGLAGCTGESGDQSGNADLPTEQYLMTDGELDIPVFLSGSENGAWEDAGLNLKPELTGYERYSRWPSTDGINMGNVNQAIFNNVRNQGTDIVLFGGDEIATNGVFVRPDSGIESPADLEGARVGVPFWNSGTTQVTTALIQEEYGLDVREDTEATEAGPATLGNLLTEQEDLDAIIEFTLFTIKGMASPDTVDMIFAPQDYWEERTGFSPFVTTFAAERSYLEENPGRAVSFMEGWNNAITNFRDNVDEYMDRYGRFAGLETDAEIDVVREKYSNNDVTIAPEDWGQERIDNHFELYEIIEKHGIIDDAPSEEGAMTYSELQDMT
jgi:ABC-type nitrate/sulfonate/bicarbonate transport system substrate-binding protein